MTDSECPPQGPEEKSEVKEVDILVSLIHDRLAEIENHWKRLQHEKGVLMDLLKLAVPPPDEQEDG